MSIIINETPHDTVIKEHISEVRHLLEEHHNHTFADDQIVLFALQYYLLNQKINDKLKVPIKKEAVKEAILSNQADF